MPNGIPVATVAVNAAHDASLLAVQMLALSNETLMQQLVQLKADNLQKVKEQQQSLQ